jgi:hypothetical protein
MTLTWKVKCTLDVGTAEEKNGSLLLHRWMVRVTLRVTLRTSCATQATTRCSRPPGMSITAKNRTGDPRCTAFVVRSYLSLSVDTS